jgi:hypothetical protein
VSHDVEHIRLSDDYEGELSSEFLANILGAVREMLSAPPSSHEALVKKLLTNVLANSESHWIILTCD